MCVREEGYSLRLQGWSGLALLHKYLAGGYDCGWKQCSFLISSQTKDLSSPR